MSQSNKNIGTYTAYSVTEEGVETLLNKTSNLIVDNGLDLINTKYSGEILHTCKISSDSKPVSPLTNQIPSIVASTSSKISSEYGSQDEAPYYYWYRITFEFGPGVANGNLSKVGITDSSDNLFSVALFKDSEGAPTTIQPINNERLRIVYEYRVFIVPTDSIFEDVKIFNDSDTLYKITIRPSEINASSLAANLHQGLYLIANDLYMYSGEIGTVLGSPSNYIGAKTNAFSWAPYSNRSLIKTLKCTLGYNEFNVVGGIRSLKIRTSRGNYQIGIEPPLIKNDTQIMRIEIPITTGR